MKNFINLIVFLGSWFMLLFSVVLLVYCTIDDRWSSAFLFVCFVLFWFMQVVMQLIDLHDYVKKINKKTE